MLKKTVLGVLVAALVGAIAVFVWARSVLAQDSVRTAIAARLTQALGQPVSIGGIGASIYPRVAVDLYNVTIGPQANIRVNSLRIGTDFRALLSRRIEHGSMRLTGARLQLPLPAFAPATPAPQETLLKGEQPLSGAVVANLSPALSDELGVGDWQGVVIEKIRRGSYADQFDFQPGDILIKINDAAVSSVADVKDAVSKSADNWAIAINRGGQTKTIQVH